MARRRGQDGCGGDGPGRPRVGRMPIPPHVAELRRHLGHDPLWLTGVTAIVLRDDPERPDGPPQALLVKRSDDGRYTPVSGIVDPREHPADTAVREAMEETCVQIAVERLIAVRVVGPITYPNGDVSDYVDHTFRCRWVSGDPYPADGENTDARFFRVDDLPEMPPVHADRARVAIENRPEARLGRLGR